MIIKNHIRRDFIFKFLDNSVFETIIKQSHNSNNLYNNIIARDAAAFSDSFYDLLLSSTFIVVFVVFYTVSLAKMEFIILGRSSATA